MTIAQPRQIQSRRGDAHPREQFPDDSVRYTDGAVEDSSDEDLGFHPSAEYGLTPFAAEEVRKGRRRDALKKKLLTAAGGNSGAPDRPCDEYDDGVVPGLSFPRSGPGQPVDARWRTVCSRARAGIFDLEPEDDLWIRRGLAFMRALLNCRNDADRENLASAALDIEAAFRLHRHRHRMTRGLVEARLLARQSFADVATAAGMTADAVQAYEALFFCVVHRLHAREWIISNAIGPKCWDGLTERDVDVIVKRVAFFMGPIALEIVLKYFTSGWSVPPTLAGLTSAELKELCDRLSTRALILAWTLPYPQCQRALVLSDLVRELGTLADSLPEDGAAAPLAEREVWFSAWRQAVAAASGRLSGPKPRAKARAA